MTYAEQLLAEGRAEGEAKGEQRAKVQIVEGLLQAGVAWEVIDAATGLTEAGFKALKRRHAGRSVAQGAGAANEIDKWT
ncbi:MAG: hypothetical protein OXP66_08560 [Candidatus Tectomicrobia bacterium]|nr:hypothetical protein [Candidatus Tectomicrobia bacterium]